MRTHQCGELRPEHIGQHVTLTGWVATRREHGEKLAFLDIRDHTGVTQAVVDNAVDVRSEYVVLVLAHNLECTVHKIHFLCICHTTINQTMYSGVWSTSTRSTDFSPRASLLLYS